VKIWVVACSSEKEVYSLAMMLQEYADRRNIYDRPIKIFATILMKKHWTGLKGEYTSNSSVKEIPNDLLNKYFIVRK